LRCRRVIFGEGYGYDRVIENVARCDICIQILKMFVVE
jgi:hypothetical protein